MRTREPLRALTMVTTTKRRESSWFNKNSAHAAHFLIQFLCLHCGVKLETLPDPTTATSMKTSRRNRLRILLNHFTIIRSRPATQKKGIYVGAEERGPRQSSDRDAKIYCLAVPVLKKTLKFGHFMSWSCSGGREMYKKAWCTCSVVVLLTKPIAF